MISCTGGRPGCDSPDKSRADGTFEVGPLPPGSYRVTLVASERRIGARGAGANRTFDRLFPRRYDLVVRVDDREFHRVEVSAAPGSELTRTLDVYQVRTVPGQNLT